MFDRQEARLQAVIDKMREEAAREEAAMVEATQTEWQAQTNSKWRVRFETRLNRLDIVSETHFNSNGGMIAKAGGLEL